MELVRRYSNRADLQERLAEAVRTVTRRANQDQEVHDEAASGRAPRVWRVRDRLTAADIEQLIAEFLAGTSKRVLAERYVISVGTVKNILRKHGVRRPNSS